ncbi:dienelactone hydrolase family protein [Sporothrix brasiliensis 5110]|uniref:Dienelactone hydrolase family protein n=1 Tax=Sporothrix brasiliensis 5110 TaxID=1398154 RepID=A0A0C2J7U6_9PEZI|nr:dienelactone hydrolase family protein [Sporothrix brasiliensis 5110]KIH93082.1 dienelactone hydrolase family protein [Sporothrix brasiliensis 5110]
MTAADLATRAPESDAAEEAAPAVPSSAATASGASQPAADEAAAGPKLCDDCVTDRPTPNGRVPAGEIRKLGDVDTYVVKPSGYPHAPARLLLLLTGGTGLPSTNNQIQADLYADEGFVVVMPDLFGGDVAPNSAAVEEEVRSQESTAAGGSFLDLFKTKAAETVKSFMIDMWLARHTEAKVLPLLHRVLRAARDEFADAVARGDGVYAVGYCFGGRYVLLLAGDKASQYDAEGPTAKPSGAAPAQGTRTAPATTSGAADPNADVDVAALEEGLLQRPGPLIKAGVLAHATLVSPDDFKGLQAPISMVCVESDPMFPDAVRTAGEDYLSQNNVEHEVQVYPGVPHGFAVVGDYADASIKEAQAVAFEQMLKWLNAH